MVGRQVVQEPEVKPPHKDVWTSRIENISDHKIEHVAYRNGVEVLREEEVLTDECELDDDEEHPYDYRQKRIVINHSGGCGDEATTPYFKDYGFLNMTVQEIQIIYEGEKKRWEASEEYADLKQMVSSMNDNSKVPITNIVYLAIGSFHDCQLEDQHRAHAQLAALNTIRGLVDSDNIRCIAQAPAYDEFDKEFLGLHGYEALNDPAGFAAINNGSLVLMVGRLGEMIDVISRGSWPAALITNKIMSRIDEKATMPRCEASWETVESAYSGSEDQRMNMIVGCQFEPFLNAVLARESNNRAYRDNSWNGVNIYWRRKDS